MVRIHVEQITDTVWEIRTGDNHEDRVTVGKVQLFDQSTAEGHIYYGADGQEEFIGKDPHPGKVIGEVIDRIIEDRGPRGLSAETADIAKGTIRALTDDTSPFARQQSSVFDKKK